MKCAKKEVVVVGAGIAGILAALWAQACGSQVTLIERASHCGGLLASFTTATGVSFDYGTHIPCLNSHKAINDLLFGDHLGIDWAEILRLEKGNFFCGKLNTYSQFIDIRNLDYEDYIRAFTELINQPESEVGAENLEDELRMNYGPYLTDEIFKPLLRRLYKTPFDQLSPAAHRFLAYFRVVAASEEISRELKASSLFDTKIAFSNSNDGGVDAAYRYPKNGGTGAWIEALVADFIGNGGHLMTDMIIEKISSKTQMIHTKNGTKVNFDKLVWTGPLALLARMIWPEKELTRPIFVPTRLHHFVVSQMPRCNSHYIYMNQPNFLSFRVTLYSNITNSDQDSRVTVEAVAEGNDAESESQRVFDELKMAGILGPNTEVTFAGNELLMAGFPEMTLELQRQNNTLREELSQFENVILGGRGAGESFFMNDVLFDVGVQMQKIFGTP